MTKEDLNEVDFELPEMESTGVFKIHTAGQESVCVSCEG